jgi:Lanthionine synthetase C-like protein
LIWSPNRPSRCKIQEFPSNKLWGTGTTLVKCCGAAGVGEFFLGFYTAMKEKAYLTFAQRIAVHLISRAERVEDGMKWTQSENRLQPYHLLAQTGLMQGAAGIGLFLVHVAQISRHQKALIQFPDETAVGKQPNRHASIKRR